MQISTLLTKQIKNEIPNMHSYRLKSLIDCSESLLVRKRLTLTDLGRELLGDAKVRSNIKRVDRLLGNKHLENEIPQLFTMMARKFLVAGSKPIILIDWTCLSALHGQYLLRASTSVKGRSMVVYQEVHPKKHENNHDTHIGFLAALAKVMPDTVHPVIVTDAGFRAIWFHEVKKLGYDFVGRIRNKNAIQFEENADWIKSASLYDGAKNRPEELGHGLLTKANPILCRFIRYKALGKQRTCNTLKGTKKQDGMNKRYAKANKEPWLLVTSLSSTAISALQIVQIYRKRMQIEEDIRDTKSSRFGFSLALSGTRDNKRMNILLLIGMLTTFMCWLAAIIAKMRGIAQDFQARSAKFAHAISYVFLGREVLMSKLRLRETEYDEAIHVFQQMASRGVS